VLELRPASPEDAALLRRWAEQPHVIAAGADWNWAWEEELARSPEWREQWIVEAAGRPIGT
jgi:aminoglycoside 6'-N-acetyltransferase